MKKKILLALLIAFTAYLGSMTADIQAKDLISTNTNQKHNNR